MRRNELATEEIVLFVEHDLKGVLKYKGRRFGPPPLQTVIDNLETHHCRP
jgi:hypothetical protein